MTKVIDKCHHGLRWVYKCWACDQERSIVNSQPPKMWPFMSAMKTLTTGKVNLIRVDVRDQTQMAILDNRPMSVWNPMERFNC